VTSVVITSIITGAVIKLALIGGGVRLAPDVLRRLQIAATRQPKPETKNDPANTPETAAPDQQVPRAA
jgi:hypothetical protein